MGRRHTGQLITPNGERQRSWAIRFRAYGKRRFVTLGRPEDGWNRERAEAQLRYLLADVERGIWQPPKPDPETVEEPRPEPTFHEFASEWFERHRREWREHTVSNYRWALTYHLLPFFADHRLSAITVAEVDRYAAAKLAERRIAPAQINQTLTRLAQVLGEAVEYELIGRNPASGKRRRVNARRPPRTWVEPEQLPSLLDGATGTLRPVLAVLAGCGLRVSEATALDWPDTSIPTRTLTIGRAKTDAGVREVDIPIGALEELIEWRTRRPTYRGEGDPVFVVDPPNGRPPKRQTRRNVEAQIKRAIKRANPRLAELGIEPISERVTPHSLRRTYASIRAACGDDPVYITVPTQTIESNDGDGIGSRLALIEERGDLGSARSLRQTPATGDAEIFDHPDEVRSRGFTPCTNPSRLGVEAEPVLALFL
jgi:integrase